jgi:spermidine/putrescine transport system permease protein
VSTATRSTAGAAEAPSARGLQRVRQWRAMPKLMPIIQMTPAFAIFACILIVPLAAFVVYSFWTVRNYNIVADWNIDNYSTILGSHVYLRLLRNTLFTGLATAAATTIVSYAFAHVLRFELRKYQERLFFLVLVAMFSGYLVRILAWRTLLGDHGIVNTLLMRLHLISQPLTFLMYNRFATILVLANFLIPLAIVPIYSSLQNIRDCDVEAARDLGCRSVGAFWRVTLPLAWPGVFTAFALTFILVCGDYTTPTLVGGTSGTLVGQAIGESFLSQFDWPQGAALAFVMMGVVLFSVGALRWASGKVVR